MEWKECTINDVCTLINGRAYSNNEMLEEGKYKIVRVGNLSGGNSNWYYSDLELPKDKYCHKGDLLFAWACTFGPHIWNEDNTIYHYHIWKMVENSEKIDKKFFYYYLKYATGSFLGAVNGSVMVHITKASMEKMPIRIPSSVITQSRIASILSSLDSKIETNNKINAKLEEMAQALFKSWFVDFEPFKDKGMVESELGMIPVGWRVGKLSEIAEVAKKSINPSKQPDTLFSHYSLPAFDENKLPAKQYGSEIMSNKFIFSNKTTLLSKLNPHIKRIWYIEETEDNAICSTEFLPFKAKDVGLSAFLYSYLVSDFFYLKALSIVQGATNSHQRLDAKVLLEYELPINDEAMLSFDKIVSPMLATICKNRVENARLSHLRDTLLPKLMSGEIEV